MAAGVLLWLGLKLLPSDEKAIRTTMEQLVQAASVKPGESSFAKLSYPDRIAAFFTTNAVVHLEGLGGEFSTIANRTDLLAATMAARSQLRQAEFKLASLEVTFPPETREARAFAVVTGEINHQTNQFGQGFEFALRKTGGRWLIAEINTVDLLR